MSTILVVYDAQPKFPATDQNPQATRHQLGGRWWDVLNGPPTQAELDAFDAAVVAQNSEAKDVQDTIAASLKIAFNHENRIRALESKPPVTRAQFLTAVRSLANPS
jgi:hypothetical protein